MQLRGSTKYSPTEAVRKTSEIKIFLKYEIRRLSAASDTQLCSQVNGVIVWGCREVYRVGYFSSVSLLNLDHIASRQRGICSYLQKMLAE